MMEHLKRALSDEEPKILEPVLIKIDTKEQIRIDKNEVRTNVVKYARKNASM